MFSASWSDSGYMVLPVYGGSCTRILRSILVLLSFVSVYSALLGPQWYMLCVSLWNFMFFYVKRWITDPEVDSRLSDHVLLPLVSDSHLFVASPEEYMIWIFWEMTSGIIFRCSALGSTVDTCMASVYEVMASFTYFLRESELGS